MEQPGKTAPWVVAIAASAGGVDALTQLLSRLPADLPAAVLIIQHLRRDRPTHLDEYLANHCPLAVRLAENGAGLETGVAYLAVPGQHVRVEGAALALDRGEPVHHLRPSADVLFASAAQAFGFGMIGVVLTGTGRDGACGCQEIKANGGVTIAQGDALHSAMPAAAIERGAIDYVLPLSEIPGKIVALVRHGGEASLRDSLGEEASP